MTIMNRGIFFIGLIGLMGMSSMTMAAGGKADGKLIVDGKPVNLSYAYASASAQPGVLREVHGRYPCAADQYGAQGRLLNKAF